MITVDGFEIMDFPAGESFVKLSDSSDRRVIINWNYENDAELMKLALITNILPSQFIYLNMPYVPHARQDRVTAAGFPFSLQVFVEMLTCAIKKEIKGLFNNHKISVVDPHSDIFEKLCRHYGLNIEVKHQWEFALHFEGQYDYVIAPDKGAVEKAAKWAAELEIPMIPCSKTRDPATGKLSRPVVPDVNLSEKRLLVVDDICDGGYTFIQLSKAICAKNDPAQLDLFVTHGIFSKGLGELTLAYNNLWTTNSLPHYKKFNNVLKVITL